MIKDLLEAGAKIGRKAAHVIQSLLQFRARWNDHNFRAREFSFSLHARNDLLQSLQSYQGLKKLQSFKPFKAFSFTTLVHQLVKLPRG